VKQQMNIVENGVNYSVKRFNDLKLMNERLVLVLKQRLDELEQQKKSFENLDAMKKVGLQLFSLHAIAYHFLSQAKTEEGIRIDSLHKEIDDTSRSISEKTHYLRKLDHMLTRLKKNQVETLDYSFFYFKIYFFFFGYFIVKI
jgi:hypothetical protein